MAGFTEVKCGGPDGTSYYEVTCCAGNTFLTGDIEGYADLGIGPIQGTHNFSSDYALTVGGVVIPIIRTNRAWTSTIESSLGQPTGPVRGIWNGNGIYGSFCDPFGPDIYRTAVSENCVIEKSTLHYLDQRYGVCLYHYVRESLQFNKAVSGTPPKSGEPPADSLAIFTGPWGREVYWKIKVGRDEALAHCVDEWHLVVDGKKQILSSIPYTKVPLSERNISTVKCGGHDEFGEIILFPAPGTYSNPQECDVLNFAWYKNGTLPGRVDYFYPDWCKALHADPIWEAAEQARIAATWEHLPLPAQDNGYVPPAITVDPIPVGSFVKHPQLGEAYQWLLTQMDDGVKVVTAPDLNPLIDASLALAKDSAGDSLGLRTNGTTLYSPISLI